MEKGDSRSTPIFIAEKELGKYGVPSPRRHFKRWEYGHLNTRLLQRSQAKYIQKMRLLNFAL